MAAKKRPSAKADRQTLGYAQVIREQGERRREHNRKYPQHATLSRRRGEQQIVQSFIDWLREWDGMCGKRSAATGLEGDPVEDGRRRRPVLDIRHMNEHQLSLTISAYLGIDYDEYQEEKDRMLQELRTAQG